MSERDCESTSAGDRRREANKYEYRDTHTRTQGGRERERETKQRIDRQTENDRKTARRRGRQTRREAGESKVLVKSGEERESGPVKKTREMETE